MTDEECEEERFFAQVENIYHPLVIGKDQVPPNTVGRFV